MVKVNNAERCSVVLTDNIPSFRSERTCSWHCTSAL